MIIINNYIDEIENKYSNLKDYEDDREMIKNIITSIVLNKGENKSGSTKYTYELSQSILVEDQYYVKTISSYRGLSLYFANKRYKNLPLVVVYEIYLKLIKKFDFNDNDVKKLEMEAKLRKR